MLYIIVINISKEIMWTRPRIVPIIAYLDLLKKPVKQKKILLISISIRCRRISESRFLKINRFSPKIKC